MIGIVIATHADYCSGVLHAVELIAGPQTNVKTIGLFHGDGIEEFEEKVWSAIEEVDDGSGVLGMVDFLGGSPSNTFLKYMRNHNMHCVRGVNMPMCLEAFMSRDYCTIEELVKICIDAGKDGIADLYDDMKSFGAAEGEEEEF